MKKREFLFELTLIYAELRVYCGEDESPLVAVPAGHGAVGFCGALCGGVLPGEVSVVGVPEGVLPEFGGVVGFVPGLLGEVLPAEPFCGIVPCTGTQGPLPGTGAGAGVAGGVVPGVPGTGFVCGGAGVVCVCGVL